MPTIPMRKKNIHVRTAPWLIRMLDLLAMVICKRAGFLDHWSILLGLHPPAKDACEEETEYFYEQGIVEIF